MLPMKDLLDPLQESKLTMMKVLLVKDLQLFPKFERINSYDP
jgi:hypothetical protein